MAQRFGLKAWANWKIHPWCDSEVVPASELQVEEVEPYRMASYAPIQYRLRNGWPQAVPPYDVHLSPSVTCDATIGSARWDPTMITTYSSARWIANKNYTGTVWSPYEYAAAYSGLTWETNATYSPTLQPGYSYRSGKEIFVVDALNFTQDNSDHMWSGGNWPSALSGKSTYTMIMVIKPNPSLNPDANNGDDDEYSGIVCPVTSAVGQPGLRINSNRLEFAVSSDLDPVQGGSILSYQASNQPVYLAWVVSSTVLRTFLGYGPKSLVKTAQYNKYHGTPINWALNLMSASDDSTHTANMMLMDLCFYDHTLSDATIANRVSLLSASYGGH